MSVIEVCSFSTDYNGTLVMDQNKGHLIFSRICTERGVQPPTFQEFRQFYSSGPYSANLQAHGVEGEEQELADLVHLYWPTYPSSKLAKRAWEFLVKLRDLGIPRSLITRLEETRAQISIRKRDLYQFFNPYIFVGVEDKRPILQNLSFQCGSARLLFVTDTVRDIREAKEAGCTVGAFTRGYGLPEALQAAEPDFLFDSWPQLFEKVHFIKL